MIRMPHEHNRRLLEALVPSMRYDGREAFAAWQTRARAKLAELLGLPLAPCDAQVQIELEASHDTFDEVRFVFQSEEGYAVPCHLWTPKGAKGPLPVVVCLQGHSKGMHVSMGRPKYEGDANTIQAGDRDFAVRVIKEGYCALIVEQRCFGECGGKETGPDCTNSSMTALLIGRTTLGERVWDVQRALDVLAARFSQVDMGRVVCMGNSGGGTTAFYAGCLDERIGYSLVSSAFCTYDDSIAAMHHCPCNYVPGIRRYFDMGDLAGLIAPRVLVVVSGREDPIFPQDGVQKAYATAKEQFAAAGAPDKLSLVVGEEGHRFYADAAWPVMNAYLQGGQ